MPLQAPDRIEGFPPEIEHAVNEARAASGSLISAACGSGARAKDVSDALRIHAKLGWQLWNLAHAPTLGALKYVPNSHSLGVLRTACVARQLDEALVTHLQESVELLDRAIQRHGGDREVFEMILDARAQDSGDLKWRKQAFVGNSFIFGAKTKCTVATAILFPAREADMFSLVRLHGMIDLVRTREGVRWPFSSLVVERPGKERVLPDREPVDLEAGEIPLMKAFCSEAEPRIQRERLGDSLIDEILPGPVGLTGATTIFTGEIVHQVGPAYGNAPGQVAHFGSGIRTPSEVLVSDHIVHKSLFREVSRELRVYSELLSSTSRDDRDRLQVSERLQRLGTGLRRVQTANVPRYDELLRQAFARIKMDPEEFEVYRVVMQYPPMPASVMIRHELPQKT